MIVDASVWVSYLNTQDVNHDLTARWMEPLLGSGEVLLAPTLMPVEVAGAITRVTRNARLGKKAVEEILGIAALELLPLDHSLMHVATEVASTAALKGADAVYVATAISADQPLVTWDRQMLDHAPRLVPTHSPASMLEDPS